LLSARNPKTDQARAIFIVILPIVKLHETPAK
jgi:hypothetical protein